VSTRPVEEALAEADTIQDGPLAGLPLLVKDTETLPDSQPLMGPSLHSGAAPAAADSSYVERLRAAGAIVIGKTNVPEFAFEGFTSNDVFGATLNPWARDGSPGGSSGGAGAALVAGMATLVTATDGGIDELLGADAVLLTPTMCAEGFWADGRTLGREHPGTDSEAYKTQVTNITAHPSLSVPAGLSANGVPFGLQITGPRWADDMVLAAGAAWEAAQPWPAAAPGYEPFYGPRL